MAWAPITDLPANWPELVSSEVESLADAWQKTHAGLKDTPMLQTFNERLRREWSIEMGIVERLYTIDRGTTQLLIEKGIDTAFISHGSTDLPPVELISIIHDQREALDALFAFVRQEQPLSLSDICMLHQMLLRHQGPMEVSDQYGQVGLVELIKGDWKKSPNYPQGQPGYKYCPPEHVATEMDRLLALHAQHTAQRVAPQIEAAWLHHRFSQIHPFQDGNGRIAQCLATLVQIRAGRFPLVINRDYRDEYIGALRQADGGDIVPLVTLFDQIEKRTYIQALELSEDVLRTSTPVADLIDIITERYRTKQQRAYDQVFDIIARGLYDIARTSLEHYAVQMRQTFQEHGLQLSIKVDISQLDSSHWYRQQIVHVARRLGYFANLTRPRLWVRLKIADDDRVSDTDAEMVISFHHLGKENRGVMIATAFLDIIHKSSANDNEYYEDRNFRETHSLVEDGFTFAYTDTALNEARQRDFQGWLDQAVAVGLAEWQKQI